MKIVILGKGNMGKPLMAMAQKAGHIVDAFTSQEDAKPKIKDAEIVFLATKYGQALEYLSIQENRDALDGKIIIDITNPLSADFMSLTIGHNTSAGEEIAKLIPNSRVIKAFNTIFASVLAKQAEGANVPTPVFIAGDDSEAIDIVAKLANEFGLEAIKSGALSNARYLEPMTEMMIHLGYGLGHGDMIGFALVKA